MTSLEVISLTGMFSFLSFVLSLLTSMNNITGSKLSESEQSQPTLNSKHCQSDLEPRKNSKVGPVSISGLGCKQTLHNWIKSKPAIRQSGQAWTELQWTSIDPAWCILVNQTYCQINISQIRIIWKWTIANYIKSRPTNSQSRKIWHVQLCPGIDSERKVYSKKPTAKQIRIRWVGGKLTFANWTTCQLMIPRFFPISRHTTHTHS